VTTLAGLFEQLRDGATLPACNQALEDLGRFIVNGPMVATSRPSSIGRFELLVLAVERIPEVRRRVRACLSVTLAGTSAEKLFAVVGLPNDRGLVAEGVDRIAHFLLPTPPDEHDLAALVARIVRSTSDYDWLVPEVDPLLQRFSAALEGALGPLSAAAVDAIGLIASRVSVLGMGENLRSRSRRTAIHDSPFFKLGRVSLAEMSREIDACRGELDRIRGDLEEHGVSVDVVYSIDAIERGLRRIERLLPLSVGAAGDPEQTRALMLVLGGGLIGERSFSRLVADNMRLLARKVIERAGRTGEHYVTSSRAEYFKMLWSAAGGGVLTAGTAIGKFLIKWGYFALFIDGLLSSLVYAGSFLAIQFCGFTLATKQPSMTAAALAGTIRESAGPDRMSALIALIARISRSQFAAAVGNVGAVIVVAFACDLIYKLVTGAPFLDAETAKAAIASFDPLSSGTIFFAALTGVLLWISSLVAGWFENWLVYRRLPEAIEHHRLGRTIGKERMARAARFLEREAAGLGGSVSLGFLLGMMPVFAKFFGLPLDVRHVTLSSGSLSLAISSIGLEGGWAPILWGWAGIACIGLLNFGVSFALALVIALRARDVPRGEQRTLPWAVLRRFLQRPIEFLWPPKEAPGEALPEAHH
jgi:site-specific recombinase